MEHIQERKPRMGPRKFVHSGKLKRVKEVKSNGQDFSSGPFKATFSVLTV